MKFKPRTRLVKSRLCDTSKQTLGMSDKSGWRRHDVDEVIDIAGHTEKRKRTDEDSFVVLDKDDTNDEPVAEAKRAKRFDKDEIAKKLAVVDDVNLTIAKSSIPQAGNGLFAKRDFEIGDPITGYEGQLLKQADALKLVKEKKDTHLRTLISLRFVLDGTKLSDGTAIDLANPMPQIRGKGGAAFVNDNGASGANAEFELADDAYNHTVDEEIERELKGGAPSLKNHKPEGRIIFIRATKKIKRGNEIFVHYGEDYWNRQK